LTQENNFFFLIIHAIIINKDGVYMKKNAFTLVELLGSLVILGIISTIAVVSYSNYINSSKKKSYQDGEITMRAASESFLTYCSSSLFVNEDCKQVPASGESVDIDLSTLVKNGFMDPVNDQSADGLCTGKVTITNHTTDNNGNYDLEYKICLTCSDYKSQGCE